MNTYSSVKSFDSQIQGRRMQEPNIAVMQGRHQQSPKYHSPEQHLDQIVMKYLEPTKTLKKKQPTQGIQGKPKPLSQTIKKPQQQSVSVKKHSKRAVSPKKKKSHTVDIKKQQKITKVTSKERRDQLGLGKLNEKQIKQRIKKMKLKVNNIIVDDKKKIYQPNPAIQHYMNQKKMQDTTSNMQQQIVNLLEKQRKMENLAKLDESVKEIFKKCKTLEGSQPQTPKLVKKKKKIQKKQNNKQQSVPHHKGHQHIHDDLKQRFQDMQLKQQQQILSSNQTQNIQETVEEEREDSQLSDNELQQQIFQTLQEFQPTQYLLEKIAQILDNQEDINPQELSEQDLMVLQFHFMNEAAVKIQSVWRGVSIRKQLLQELQEMLMMQQEEEIQEEDEKDETGDKEGEISQRNQFNNFQKQQQKEEEKSNKKEIQPKQKIQKVEEFIPQEQFQQHYTDDNKIFDQKMSDQTEDLVLIQQPNSPVNQEIYFYNPFIQTNQQSNEKQVHYSTIKSSVISEDEQKSALSASILQQIQQELDQWNNQIEQILQQGQEKESFANVKQQMQQTILNIVSQHIKKQKHERKDSEQSVDFRIRNLQETNNEKTFNDARKRLQKAHEYSEEKQSSQKDCLQDLNRSSLVSLQSQLLKKETELLNMREEAIQLRYKAELKKISDSDNIKKTELDEWLEKELEDLQATKQVIEQSRKKEQATLKKIQRDISIAQTFDENNPKLQSLKQQIDEEFSNIKQQKQHTSDIKIVNHFDVEHGENLSQMPETFSEFLQPDNLLIEQKNDMKQNIIESDKQIETYQTISALTNELLDELIENFTEEILINRDQLQLLVSNLITSQQCPSLPTSISDIQSYIQNFFQFALTNHKDEIIRNINIPYGFTPFKRMQLIHGYDDEEEETDEDEFHAAQQQLQIAFPLDESYFLEFEQYRLQETNDEEEIPYAIKELEHIHNKAIFDACNEALNYFRPNFFNSGLPYPWEHKKKQQEIIIIDLSSILKQMESKVLQWAGTLGGFLPVEDENDIPKEKKEILDEKNQQMMLQQLHQLENPLLYDSQISQQMFDHLAQIRDERLYKMLISDIKENEYRWYLVEDDRAEFLMELSDMIFEQLVEEMATEQLQQ